MSSTAGADQGASLAPRTDNNSSEHGSDDFNDNNGSPGNKPTHKRSHDDLDGKEDPETQAASEDLRKSTISDRQPAEGQNEAIEPTSQSVQDKDAHESKRVKTPERAAKDAADEEMKDRVLSPKKKRGRELDADDDVKELEAQSKLGDGEAGHGASSTNGSRSTRLGPEKKRYRDSSTEPPRNEERLHNPEASDSTKPLETTTIPEKTTDSTKKPDLAATVQTPSSAFASSGFSSHVGTTSGFGAIGATKSTSVFGSGSSAPISGFGALGSSAAAKPLSSFASPSVSSEGNKDKEATNTPLSGFGAAAAKSGFGGLGGGLGGGFGGGFGSGFAGGSGPKLSSFASGSTPKIIGASDKPTKAFGAPDSDEEEEGSDDDGSDGEGASDKDNEDTSKGGDDKKKAKISKVPVTIHDGEEDENTLIQVRAKLFALVGKEGWKERGVGAIKLNAAKAGFENDEITGEMVAVDDATKRSARLIMRQESTHRVILNSPLLKAIKFSDDKAANGTYKISFTAVEDNKPVNLLLKMSETNALGFLERVRDLQTKL